MKKSLVMGHMKLQDSPGHPYTHVSSSLYGSLPLNMGPCSRNITHTDFRKLFDIKLV